MQSAVSSCSCAVATLLMVFVMTAEVMATDESSQSLDTTSNPSEMSLLIKL